MINKIYDENLAAAWRAVQQIPTAIRNPTIDIPRRRTPPLLLNRHFFCVLYFVVFCWFRFRLKCVVMCGIVICCVVITYCYGEINHKETQNPHILEYMIPL